MDYSKRTPGPWKVGHEHLDDADTATIHAANGDWIAQSDDLHAAFIVACENAMTKAGIVNPEAVQEIVGALEEGLYVAQIDADDEELALLALRDVRTILRAALAKAKGVEG